MDWLTKLPVIGPVAAWFFRTRVWRVYRHLDDRKWTRLAAAITFTSFVALFPMIAVAAAVGAALLPADQMDRLQGRLTDQVPGIARQLDLQGLVDNAGTVGVVAGALLLLTGVSWAGSLRESLRSVWDLAEDPGNPVLLKLKDLGTLVGLGLVGLVSLGGSAFAVSAVGWSAGRLGLADGGVGTVLLRTAGYVAAVAADFVLLWYLLTVLPGVRPTRRATLVACLLGAVGMEVLKLLLGGYLSGVAARNLYGAFGVPVALLLWINFETKLVLFCAGWTATQRTWKRMDEIDALGGGEPERRETERAAPAPRIGRRRRRRGPGRDAADRNGDGGRDGRGGKDRDDGEDGEGRTGDDGGKDGKGGAGGNKDGRQRGDGRRGDDGRRGGGPGRAAP